jgi:dCTP deaminase
MQLSAQTIRDLAYRQLMIFPFQSDKIVVRGKSAGLSAASYDMTIGHDLVLGVNPAYIIQNHILDFGLDADFEWGLQNQLRNNPPYTALAYTTEDLHMPNDVAASVADKSSYARVFCSAFNTFIDPGFHGNLTLELVNHGAEPVIYKAGDPVVQLLFTKLDQPTDRPYVGKYNHQTKAAHPARIED